MTSLLRLFLIYLLLLGLIYMIPFPYRMTKEGFTNGGLSLSVINTDNTNDQTMYTNSDNDQTLASTSNGSLQTETTASDNDQSLTSTPTSSSRTGTAGARAACTLYPVSTTPDAEICSAGLKCVSVTCSANDFQCTPLTWNDCPR